MRAIGLGLLVLSSTFLAGCVGPGSPVDPASAEVDETLDWALRAVVAGKGHDHQKIAHHRGLSSGNFEQLGWDPLLTEAYGGASAGGYFCGDAAVSGERRLAVVHGLGTKIAFVLSDVTDPANPVKLSEMALGGTAARDVAMTPDQRWIVLGASFFNTRNAMPRSDAAPALTLAANDGYVEDSCTGTRTPLAPVSPLGYPSGAVLVDISDPTAPKVADYFPLPVFGTHSIGVAEVDGKNIVLASVLNSAQPTGYYAFFTIEGGRLVFQSAYDSVPVVRGRPVLDNWHNDGWIHKHPVTGQTLAYLADWDGGLVVLDVSELRAPREVARWAEFESEGPGDDIGSIHTALVLDELWDGRHYTFLGQEIINHPADTPTGIVYVLDTTDPANPERVGAWTLPVDPEWNDEFLVFSTHYIAHQGRTLFVSMYHGGVWAVDVEDPTMPRSVGVFLPSEESPKPPKGSWYSPTVMEVKPLGGDELVLWDGNSGLYTVRFDASDPAPLLPEWDVP